jgi:hypothetical protein
VAGVAATRVVAEGVQAPTIIVRTPTSGTNQLERLGSVDEWQFVIIQKKVVGMGEV